MSLAIVVSQSTMYEWKNHLSIEELNTKPLNICGLIERIKNSDIPNKDGLLKIHDKSESAFRDLLKHMRLSEFGDYYYFVEVDTIISI
jgi:hypothetical protein